MRKYLVPPLALLVVLLAGCAATPPEVPAVTVTVTAEPEESPPSAPTESEPVETPSSRVESEVQSTPADVESFAMPDVLGQNLQFAQDTLQSLGSYFMDQEDALGLGRFQMIDSNWKVCAQDPAAGSAVPVDVIVTLAAVKLDETCP